MKDKNMFEKAFEAIGTEAAKMLEEEKDAIKGKVEESKVKSATITLTVCVDLSGKAHAVSTKFKVVADSVPVVNKSVVVGEDPDQLGLPIAGSVTVRKGAAVIPADDDVPEPKEGDQVLFPNLAMPVTATETPALAKKRGRKPKADAAAPAAPAPKPAGNPFGDDDAEPEAA